MNAQIYCTAAELIEDLHLPGREPGLMRHIQAASRFIQRRIGAYLPVSETRAYLPSNRVNLYIDPCLAVVEVQQDGIVVDGTDWVLNPYGRHWHGGPYTRLENLCGVWWSDVSVIGRWGLYEETAALGINVTLTDSAAALAVENGALVSPGMVLLIDTEQVLVSGWGAATDSGGTLAEAADEAQEEIEVSNGTLYHEGEVIQLSTEDLYVRMVRGDVLVVGRGWNGTTKAEHLENAVISVYRSVRVERGVNGTTTAAHSNVLLQRYIIPEDVNWLARQIAGLMRMKAAAGFAGKSGSAELGETFYYNEFPGQIKEIQRNYRITRL